MKKLTVFAIAALISITLVALLSPSLVYANGCPTTLDASIIAGPYLLVDSNKPGIEGPKVATVSALVTNTGASPANNVFVYIGDGTTPGHFPPGSDSNSLTIVGGVSDATRYIIDLAPGESKTIFWQVAYPPTFGQTYSFSVWADNEAGCFAQDSHTFTTRSALSAAANKLLGTISRQPASGIVNPGNMVIVTITDYNLGEVGEGPNDEEDAWFQPVGNLDFDPTCFRLVKTSVYIHSIENVPPYDGMPYIDETYFPGIESKAPPPSYNYNSSDYVKYYFIALKECSTRIMPYQEVASGQEEKYSKDNGKSATTIVLTSEPGGLSFHKAVSPSSAGAGDSLTWTISYGNTTAYAIGDPGSGNGLVVVDEGIPAHTTYVPGSAACSQSCVIFFSTDDGATWTTTEPPANQVTQIKWYINEIIPANTDPAGTVSFQTVVNPGTPPGTTICNTASARIGEGEPLIASSICANAGAPQVEAYKRDSLTVDADSNGVPSPGDTIEYTITINNGGNEVAQNVVFTDTPDANTSLVVGSVNIAECAGCLVTSGNDPGDVNVGVNVGELAPQESVTIYFSVIIQTGCFTSIANQGTVSGTNFANVLTDDPDTPAVDDPTITPVTKVPPEVTITKFGPEDAVVDSNITYTGTLSNVSNATAYNAVLVDYLPDGVSFVSSSHTAVYNSVANTVTWALGDFPPGASIPGWVTVHISDAVPDNTVLTDTFSVTWDDCDYQPYGPATDTWDTTVHTHPQLTVEKTGPGQAYPGQNIIYTISVENIGGLAAQNVVLTDTLPSGLSYVSSNPEATSHNGVVTWNLGTINAEGAAIITLTVNVGVGVPNGTTLTDTASVVWDSEGPVIDSWDTTVYTQPQLIITKLGPAVACADSPITYTGTLSNVGGTTAYNAVLVDYLPDGMSFVSSSHAAVYDPVANTVTWALGDLPS
ncbi:MAG: DUF11 domain-containing protein, partial [Chloroflexota bacterium]